MTPKWWCYLGSVHKTEGRSEFQRVLSMSKVTLNTFNSFRVLIIIRGVILDVLAIFFNVIDIKHADQLLMVPK